MSTKTIITSIIWIIFVTIVTISMTHEYALTLFEVIFAILISTGAFIFSFLTYVGRSEEFIISVNETTFLKNHTINKGKAYPALGIVYMVCSSIVLVALMTLSIDVFIGSIIFLIIILLFFGVQIWVSIGKKFKINV